MNSSVTEQILQQVQGSVDANKGYFYLWKSHVLFVWQWWLQLALTIVPIALWIVLRKRDSTARLLYVGFFVMLVTSWMDFVGSSFGLWYYPIKLIPTIPPFFPWETCITVTILLLLQYKPAFSPWLKAFGFGLADTFVGEPMAKWMGLYIPLHWRYIYSLPIYIAIYLTAHYLARSNSFEKLGR